MKLYIALMTNLNISKILRWTLKAIFFTFDKNQHRLCSFLSLFETYSFFNFFFSLMY